MVGTAGSGAARKAGNVFGADIVARGQVGGTIRETTYRRAVRHGLPHTQYFKQSFKWWIAPLMCSIASVLCPPKL